MYETQFYQLTVCLHRSLVIPKPSGLMLVNRTVRGEALPCFGGCAQCTGNFDLATQYPNPSPLAKSLERLLSTDRKLISTITVIVECKGRLTLWALATWATFFINVKRLYRKVRVEQQSIELIDRRANKLRPEAALAKLVNINTGSEKKPELAEAARAFGLGMSYDVLRCGNKSATLASLTHRKEMAFVMK